MPSSSQRQGLPRLHPASYQGHSAVHWTLTTHDRQPLPLSIDFHHRFRLLLLHTLSRGHLACPVYCLMPDHLHMIWMGYSPSCDQRTSIAFLDTYLEPLLAPAKLQPQPHDHVLRNEELGQDAFQNAIGYIMQNPVRAGLVREPQEWPYLDAMIPGYPKLDMFELDHWPKFSRILTKLRFPKDAP